MKIIVFNVIILVYYVSQQMSVNNAQLIHHLMKVKQNVYVILAYILIISRKNVNVPQMLLNMVQNVFVIQIIFKTLDILKLLYVHNVPQNLLLLIIYVYVSM